MMLEILVNAAVRMLLVGGAAWLTLRIVRVRNPHVETLVWRMVLLAGLSLPALLYWRLAPSFPTSVQFPVIAAAGTGGADTSGVAAAVSLLPMAAPVAIYLAVALLLLGRLAVGLAGMWRLSRAARPMTTTDDVRVSAHVRSPATFGTIVLLPVDAHAWPADRLDAVLAHERAHVRARDGYWSWLAQLHAAIFWFSPVGWWMQRRLEALAETTSDDAVVAARHDPIAYAALPRVVRWSAFAALIPAVVLAASTTQAAPPAEPAAAAVLTTSAAIPVPTTPGPIHAVGVRLIQPANPDIYYPAVAKQERVSGYAIVEVDVDVLGQLVDARVLKVQPTDPQFGFADAALQVARNTTFGNTSQQVGSMKFMVKFELKE